MPGRRPLLRWAGWFAAANAGLFALVGLRFLASYPFDGDPLGVAYGVLAYVGHFALLASLPVGLVVAPLILVLPRRPWVTAIGVILLAAALTLLIVDANVFAEQRYHLTPLTAFLFETPTWIFIGIIGFFVLVFEALLAGYVWRWVEGSPGRRGWALATALGACWLGSQFIHVWADAIGHTPVTQLTRYLPAYFPVHAKRRLARLGLVDPVVAERQRLLQRAGAAAAGQLNYPLRPLQCEAPARPLNILLVLVDALRPDAIDAALLPNIAALRDQGAYFANHWSGGNSSRAGLFSLFYGLPSTYTDTFYGVQEPPVLIDRVREAGYQLALYAAPGFGAPTDIDRTAFAGIAGLPGERRDIGEVERNRAVTTDWLAWLADRDPDRPFFGFLYYDPPMGEMSGDTARPLPMDERFATSARAREAWRRYRLAIEVIDGEVGRVITSLEGARLRDDTVVVVVSDHGYEFDDNGLGYVGHASDFSPAQVKATMVVRWPGRPPATYTHRSSHYDLPVTLLQDVFGCGNDPADYSMGRNLYAGKDWDWIIAGSYNSHAILEADRVIVTHAGGFVELLGADYRPLAGAEINARIVSEAMAGMRRFYR